MTDMLTPVMGR